MDDTVRCGIQKPVAHRVRDTTARCCGGYQKSRTKQLERGCIGKSRNTVGSVSIFRPTASVPCRIFSRQFSHRTVFQTEGRLSRDRGALSFLICREVKIIWKVWKRIPVDLEQRDEPTSILRRDLILLSQRGVPWIGQPRIFSKRAQDGRVCLPKERRHAGMAAAQMVASLKIVQRP